MKCTRCDEELKDNALFCENCGTKVQQAKDENAESRTQKMSSAQLLELSDQDSMSKPDTSGVDVSAYPTATQPPVKQPVIQQTTPMPSVVSQEQSATSFVAQSTVGNQEKKVKTKAPIIVAVVAAAIALVAVIILVVTFVFGESDSTTNDSAKGYAAQKEQELASNSATNQQKESITQSSSQSSSSSIDDVIGSPNGFILPESDSRYYSDSELNALTDYQLYLARNEIYARYGRGFKNQDLQDYFHNKNWYTVRYSPDSFDSIVTLNDFEKKNADAMLAIEKRRGSSYLS